MHKIPKPVTHERHSTHNSQLYEKLLEDQHFLSQASQRQSPAHAEVPMREQSEEVEMVIQFGGNSSASLMVGSSDDPMTLAKRFCYKYNIDPRIISTLATNIKNLQMTTFHSNNYKDSVYRVDRNHQSHFDDKQNKNQLNYSSNNVFKSNQKTLSSSKIKKSRNHAEPSHNESAVISTTKSGAGVSTNRYNVFQRLYQDSRKKNFNQTANQTTKRNQSRVSLNNSNTNNRSLNESSINVCLSIYEKNTRLKQESRQHIQHLQQVKKQRQVQSCKFKPTINPLSSMIANKLRQLDESNLINRSANDRQMLKIKEYLLKREQEEMEECTFKPKVISKLSTHNSKYSTQRFLQLHEDHHYRQTKRKLKSQEKQKEAEKEHHPSINKLSKIIVNKDFFQRLEEDKAKRLNKRQSLEKIKSQKNADNRPATGRPPANRNLGQKTIGEYLYEKGRESRALTVKQQPKIFTDPKSSHIYSESKKCAFEYLFDLLDSDQDGLVSSTKINISGLGEEILRLLAPLLSEMEEVQVELNQQQFYQAFERLYSTFNVQQKNAILKFYKNKGSSSKISENPSFQPTLNEKSLLIARELCGDQGDIYDNSVMRMKQKENKLNRLRAQRMLVEYNQCTFHPNLRY